MQGKSRGVVVVLIGLLLPVSVGAFDAERESLRGVRAISVLVESLPDDIEGYGLTKSQIQTDVELRLRKAGIRVLTEEETSPGSPRLYVNVNALKTNTIPPTIPIYGVCAIVQFYQLVSLTKDGSRHLGVTWGKHQMGIFREIRSSREHLGNLVDEFINDYLTVNPKK